MRETFGTINLVAEQSGTAPMGWTLAEIEARDRVGTASLAAEFPEHTFEDAWTHRRTVLPPDASEWVSLYETDGDWLFADITRNETVWLGPEWTGEMATRFAVPWERAAAFVLWRMARLTDPGPLRPVDLRMLAAG